MNSLVYGKFVSMNLLRILRPSLVRSLGTLGVGLALCSSSLATSSVWTQTGAGPFSWNLGSNWDTNPTIPNAVSDIANFTTAGGPVSQSITLDAPITAGSLIFNNAATGYTISNGTGGSLTLDNGASAATITVAAGSQPQTIAANLTVGASGLSVGNSSTNQLTFS
jgi:hypothetical protein